MVIFGCDMLNKTAFQGSKTCKPNELVRFDGQGGDYVEFGVSHYEFPNNTEDRWDSNWLMIAGSASLNGRNWEFCDPAMTTFEIRELKVWFEELSRGATHKNIIGFTEPNFEFEYQSNSKLRVFFELEVRPEWSRSEIAGQADIFIDVDASIIELSDAASTLEKILLAFPERGRK